MELSYSKWTIIHTPYFITSYINMRIKPYLEFVHQLVWYSIKK